MSAITVNGITLELDLLDADVMERFETAVTDAATKVAEKTQYQGLSNADALRKQCKIIEGAFDALFGDGTSARLFNGKAHLGEHMDAFGQLSSMAQDANKEVSAISEKYSAARIAGLNREQRRAAVRLSTSSRHSGRGRK